MDDKDYGQAPEYEEEHDLESLVAPLIIAITVTVMILHYGGII